MTSACWQPTKGPCFSRSSIVDSRLSLLGGGQNPQSSGQHDVYQRHEFLSERRASFYSDIGRPSIDPELMMRMLMVGYCYGIRSHREVLA
jgi:Transposase domain (DUF772)